MNSFMNILQVIVVAAVVENVVFARALATSQLMDRTRNYRDIFIVGGALTLLSGLSALLIWGLGGTALFENMRAFHRPLVYIACISAVYVAICLVLRKWRPELFANILALLAGVAFSGSVLGIQVVASNEYIGFWQTLAYAVGGTLGVVIALLMIIAARERLAFSKVPRSFAGLPVLLIYIGILSLAIYGLIGHQLAA